jgi:thymidylate synthase ThyX
MRHIFKQRASSHADEAMQHLMYPLLNEFKKLIPVIFDDI